MTIAIDCQNISYSYPIAIDNTQALTNISVQLEKGKFYGIVGANGSGKSTFCSIIRGFIPKFYKGTLTGTVKINGIPVSQLQSQLAHLMGFVFQNPYSQLSGVKETVFEEVAFGLENFGMPPLEIENRVNRAMDDCDICDLALRNPFKLSGGQVQRVAFASVLVLDPDILIIDEPTSQLDPMAAEKIYKIICNLKSKNKTILLVDHRTDLIAKYADEVLLFAKGHLLEKGTPHQVLTNPHISAFGVKVPPATQLIRSLKLSLPTNANFPVTEGEAVKLIKEENKNDNTD
ncbi:energy-coupling factor ABC transporter ATP-binding protein [Levilactobacillus huananensis]|uniref:energy-coupling factor ABC transporter ATP-binding protein n=1 Tax=Levilactobacillus huananensis TaxID=2486019 RepID=UPI001CDD610D|nr:ABC transporter ATP-binding protein [Levilactobacillus huananensis]